VRPMPMSHSEVVTRGLGGGEKKGKRERGKVFSHVWGANSKWSWGR